MAETTKATKSKTTKTTKATAEKEQTVTKKISIRDVDQNQFIPVYNGFHGFLVYKSKRTGEEYHWDSFGEVQEIELRELRNIKSAAKSFFINNWFMFDDEYAWVVDYLGVGKFYKNAVSVEQFDDIFFKTPDEIETAIKDMSSGQKSSAMYRARQLIADGQIDSYKAIETLEKALGVELIEH